MESLHFETSVFERYKNDHKNGKYFEKSFSKNFMRSTNEIYFSFASLPSGHRNEYWSCGTFIKEISVYSLATLFTMLSLLLKFEDVF